MEVSGALSMSDFKDLFSRQAGDYARFRPVYPAALYDWLASQVSGRSLAVDLGCGNGQASVALAQRFDQVLGVDPSQAQLDRAAEGKNIRYICAQAEASTLPGGEAALVTVAQAFHWFKRPAVFGEMRRLLKPGGVVAVWCYATNKISPEVDAAVHRLYFDHLDSYWEPERRLVESGYSDIEFPADWRKLPVPAFFMQSAWTLEQLVGYLSTWSPLKRFKDERGFDALQDVLPELEKAWGAKPLRTVDWPISVRAFRV
jgi:SAM-dependent methyltransferase